MKRGTREKDLCQCSKCFEIRCMYIIRSREDLESLPLYSYEDELRIFDIGYQEIIEHLGESDESGV
jgi:hypothetical protein